MTESRRRVTPGSAAPARSFRLRWNGTYGASLRQAMTVSIPPAAPRDARWPRRGLATAVIASLVILVALPALPSAWAGVTHRDAVRANTRVMLGYVTVQRCSRGALHFDWSCRGRFQVNDPMAEPYSDVTGVTVANDPRHYRVGDTLDTALPFQSRVGYRWGAAQD